jgi:hypothetical protein
VSLLSAPSWAAEPQRLELDYTAQASCPDARAFEQLVRSQLAESGETSAISPARARVGFRRSKAGVVGRFELVRQDGSGSSRELEAASCDEAASALAFVLALALSGRGAPDLDSSPGQAPVAAPRVMAPSAPAADQPRPGDAERGDAERGQVDSSWHWRLGLGFQLGVRSGVAPRLTPVEAALLSLRRQHHASWGLGVRIGLVRGQPITYSNAAGDSTFKWLAARIDGCVWSAALSRFLVVTPCVLTHVGQLTVVGDPEPLPGAAGRRAAAAWIEAGAAVRLEMVLVKTLSLEAQGEALLPLKRYRFAFDRPDTNVYQVPPLAAHASLGLVVHFP